MSLDNDRYHLEVYSGYPILQYMRNKTIIFVVIQAPMNPKP